MCFLPSVLLDISYQSFLSFIQRKTSYKETTARMGPRAEPRNPCPESGVPDCVHITPLLRGQHFYSAIGSHCVAHPRCAPVFCVLCLIIST